MPLFPNALTRARGLGLMPKKELLLWAPRATGTLPPLGREKGGAVLANAFAQVSTRAKAA
jgi:hypothetical protein